MKRIGYFMSSVFVAACLLFNADAQAQEKKLKIKAKGMSPSEIMVPGASHREPVRVSSYSGHRTSDRKASCSGKKKSVAHANYKHKKSHKGSFASNGNRTTAKHRSDASYSRNTMGSFAGYRTDNVKWKKIKMKKKDGEWEYKYKR